MPFMYVSFVFQLSEFSYFWGLFRLMLGRYVVNILNLCELCCGCKVPKRLWWVVDGVQFWAFFALFTLIPTLTSLCPSHEQGQCQAVLISMYMIILLLFAAPTVIFGTINIISAMGGSRTQQSQRRDIVIFIILLFTLLFVLFNFLQQLSYIPVSTPVFFPVHLHPQQHQTLHLLLGREILESLLCGVPPALPPEGP
ncbi:Mas-related G-protein coupled receptor member H [Turdus rufiventris]|nr:Mas-related G-protein coupled receptor member H [Turdus rufiventris]